MTDYVTEKIYNVFQAGSIPVYMGAPNIGRSFVPLFMISIDEWLPDPKSIIKASDFSSPKELAGKSYKV